MSMSKDFTALRQQWFNWVLNGKGKEKHAVGKYSYDGAVFYADGTASQRLLKSKHGEWVLLCRYYATQMPDWAKTHVSTIVVPDIAVFSVYPGDWYDDAEAIHDRQKFIMLSRINALIEEVEAMHAKELEVEYRVKNVRDNLNKFYNNWNEYDHLFHLKWGHLPAHYMDKVETIIRTKIAAWRDPTAVMKRERAAARKAAKEALGLNAAK